GNIARLTLETTRNAAASAIATAKTLAQTAAEKIAGVATRLWAATKFLLGAAIRFAMGPVGLIITAIAALIAIIVVAYKRNETFRNIVNAVFAAVKNAVVGALNVVRGIVAAVWPYVSQVIRIAVTVIRTYVTTYFAVVRTVVTTVFNAVRAIVTGAINTVVATIRGVGQVVGIVRNAFNQARSAVSTAITGVVDYVRGMPNRVVNSLGDIGGKLYETGKSLIQGFINGIRNMAGNVVSTIKNFIIDKIPGPIKDALGIFSPSRVMAGIGKNVGEGLVVGIEGTGDKVSAAMTRLVPVPKSTTIRPAMAALSTTLAATVTGPLGRAAPVAAAAPVTVNVHPRAGQSEYEIGRVAAREVAWAAKR
ncbi:MAG TPA: hypothetical protein VNO31_00680, partial [Umezawaea sp.]|nr:hypothetical protein [Umezawaea sp.]